MEYEKLISRAAAEMRPGSEAAGVPLRGEYVKT